MAEKQIQLDNGKVIILDDDRKRNITLNFENLYKYRLVDEGQAVFEGRGQIVPIEDDLVYSYELGWFRVGRVDTTTFVADLHIWEPPKNATEVGLIDTLIGLRPGVYDGLWRVYYDSTVFPHRLQIDSAYHMHYSRASKARVYRGINYTESGEVVSAYYSPSGEYVGDTIPLDLVATAEGNNQAIKAPVQGYTTKKLDNGELVTVVIYSDNDVPLSIARMTIHKTNVVSRPQYYRRRIQSVELVSPFMSKTDPTTLEVPINVTVATLTLSAKVTYTDGEPVYLDVGEEGSGSKIEVLGLKYWSPTITGARTPITLKYRMAHEEEYAFNQGETVTGDLVFPYWIRGMPADPAYSLKLYAFPTWINDVSGYGLEYWLYDLERQVSRRVPAVAVSLSEDSMPFDGRNFTSVQHLKFSVNLRVVDEMFGDHVHVQAMQINLMNAPSVQDTNWRVRFSTNQTTWFGEGLSAKVRSIGSGLSTLELDNGIETYEEWLDRMYYKTNPLYDPRVEVNAPAPTHFIVSTRTRSYEFPVSQWAVGLQIANDLRQGEAMTIRWVKKMSDVTLQLSISAVPVHNV